MNSVERKRRIDEIDRELSRLWDKIDELDKGLAGLTTMECDDEQNKTW